MAKELHEYWGATPADITETLKRACEEIIKLRAQNDSQYKSLMSYITEARERERARIEADGVHPTFGDLAAPENE